MVNQVEMMKLSYISLAILLIFISIVNVDGTSLLFKAAQDNDSDLEPVDIEVSNKIELGKKHENNDDVSDFLTLLFEEDSQTQSIFKQHEDKHLLEGIKESPRFGGSFQWKDCGGSQDAVHITSITVSPVPLKLPGKVQIGFSFGLTSSVNSSIGVVIEVKKKIGPFFITVKTLTVPDLCAALASKDCPSEFSHCHCPFQKGQYSLPPTSFTVSDVSIPGGQYRVTSWMKHSNIELACVYLEFSVA
jgi:ganglioside GM2 activator